MNRTICMKHAKRLALGLAVLALAAAPSFAQTSYDLCASDGTVTIAGNVIPIWGYADITGGGPCATGLATLPGPELRATAGETLTINLTNSLGESVSFFVPGLPGTPAGGSAGKFTNEAAMGGGTASYSFTPRAGTFLYHSATDRIRTQVPMGLYGALVVDSDILEAYPDDPLTTSVDESVAYTRDEVLVYSEIDPALNADPANMDGAKVINWMPQYFLINGKAHPDTADLAITTGDDVLLRFVNAGLDSVFPTLGGGLYMNLKAEDGNRYPHPIQQYGLDLQAGKTIDAMIQVTNPDTYAIYDRSGLVTNGAASDGGMIVYINAAGGAGLLQFASATYSLAENGGLMTVTVDRVGGSAGAVSVDYATADGSATAAGLDYTAILPTTLNFGDTQTSATFDIEILDDVTWEGDEDFSVSLSNATGGAVFGTPSSAVVTIVENDEGPGVLQLSAATYSGAENGGTLTVTVDRVGGSVGDVSVDYATADGTATAGSDYTAIPLTTLNLGATQTSATFDVAITNDTTWEGDETFSVSLSNAVGASLGTPASAVATITEDDPLPNQAPIANDDTTSMTRGTLLINYDIVANDEDPDGLIAPATVVITTGTTTQRGGDVVNNDDGTITFTPKSTGWTGTDTFQYMVFDNEGAPSNVATVRINVVR